MLTERDIARLIGQIVDRYAPLAVGVFGSYATGTAHAGSDLDLVVIVDNTEPAPALPHAIRRLLFGTLHPLDIQVFSPAAFEAAAAERLSFAWVIARQVRLYHATEAARARAPALFASGG